MSTSALPALPDGVAPSPDLLHTLLTHSPVAIGLLRPIDGDEGDPISDFAWVYLNPAGQRLLRQPERPAQSLCTLFPAAQQAGVLDVCRQALTTRQPIHSQVLYHVDGVETYFLLVAQPNEGHVVVNFTETTDQAHLAIAEHLLAYRLEQALNQNLVAVNKKLLLANEVNAQAQAQLQGIATHLESRVADRTQQLSAALRQSESQHEQMQVLNAEMGTLNEELTVSNEELTDANAQLTRSNTDLDTFVYLASHDLKTPIVNIEGLLHALHAHLPSEVLADDVVKELLRMMQGSVERFRNTIYQLTDVVRLQQAYNSPAKQVQLASLVQEVHQDLLAAFTAAQAQFTGAVGLEIYILMAPNDLRSVVYNLLSNALKYRDPARPLVMSLRAAYTPESIVVEVQDNGLGLTDLQQRRLFGLFERPHSHVEGTGVGLYMIKRLIEQVKGTITVQSEAGVGSTFTVTFKR